MRKRWTKNQAWEWYSRKSWVMGVNYVPSITLHAVELWQEDTHAEVMQSVRKEIALMEEIGINGVRMFLPFSVWYHDREKFLDRFDHVLDELSAHGVTMMPVVFNDCVGFAPLPDEIPKTHGWQKYDIGYHGGHRADNPFSGEQCRIGPIYWDKPAFQPFLELYVHELIGRFSTDERVFCWDLWNEPGNSNRHDKSIPYLKKTFELARECDPVQPLTAGVWSYPQNYGSEFAEDVEPVQRVALDESDVVSFHQYENFARVQDVVRGLEREGRPMLNTEWLHRIQDNFISDNLPFYHEKKIGSYSWGLVAGKSQHFLPWDELWNHQELPLRRWQHDLFDCYFTPYDESEIKLMRSFKDRK